MNSEEKEDKPKEELDLVKLSQLCPNKCGCEKGCKVDDAIFYEAALLDDYVRRLKNKRNEG